MLAQIQWESVGLQALLFVGYLGLFSCLWQGAQRRSHPSKKTVANPTDTETETAPAIIPTIAALSPVDAGAGTPAHYTPSEPSGGDVHTTELCPSTATDPTPVPPRQKQRRGKSASKSPTPLMESQKLFGQRGTTSTATPNNTRRWSGRPRVSPNSEPCPNPRPQPHGFTGYRKSSRVVMSSHLRCRNQTALHSNPSAIASLS